MAPRIEEEGAVARLDAGLQRKVELFRHWFPVESTKICPTLAPVHASGTELILMDNWPAIPMQVALGRLVFRSRFAEVNASLSPWT
jgi:hypothetical protein